MSIININNKVINLFYLNNTIKEYSLPETFTDFKTEIKSLYHIDSRLNEELSFIYIYIENEKENKIQIKNEKNYSDMINRIEDKIKDKTILIEIEKSSNNLSQKNPETFEEEIKNVVEKELKNAGERIIKSLSLNSKKYYPSSKIQVLICDKCAELIKGDIFKSAKNVEEKYFCEKCSFKMEDEPMFVIH